MATEKRAKKVEPAPVYRVVLTEAKRKFIIEACRHILKCGGRRQEKTLRTVSELMSNLPEVMYGSGNIGDSYPFNIKPTHRTPMKHWDESSERVADFDHVTREMYCVMRHEEIVSERSDDLW